MRRGTVYRRCTRCRKNFGAGRTCKECGQDRFSWTYVVDTAPPGAPRQVATKGGFATKAAALDAMSKLQVAKDAGTYIEPSKVTVGKYLTDWAAAGCGGVRPWTLRGYESIVRVHLVPRIGEIRLQSLTRLEIKALYAQLRKDGIACVPAERVGQLQEIATRYQALREGPDPRAAVRLLVAETGRPEATVRHWVRRCQQLGLLGKEPRPAGKGLAPKSVWNVHICLRAALNDAIEDGLIERNPARGATKPPKGRSRMKTWTREEMLAFLDHISEERNYALYHIALCTGMRRGELLGLRWEDIRWNTSTISVQTQAAMLDSDEDDENEYEADDAPTKSQAGRRAIKIRRVDVHVLKRHREAQEFERRSWSNAYQDHGLVFCRPDGTPHDPDSISKGEFQRLARGAKLKRIRFHDQRHTHATLFMEAGNDITVVSKRLGHASVKTTADLYVHVTERLQETAADRFGAYLATSPEESASNPLAIGGSVGSKEPQKEAP